MRYLMFAALLAAATTGCGGECSDCETGPAVPSVSVYDDGVTLSVLGCAAQPFDPTCEWGDEAMAATIDGAAMTVPANGSADALFGGVSVSYDHRLDVASPAAPPTVMTTYGGVASNAMLGLPAFTVTGPASEVSRGSGTVGVDFDVLQNTEAVAVLTTTCGGQVTSDHVTASALGHVDLEFGSAGSGACMHRVDVSQIRFQLVAPPADLDETVVRLAAVTFTSTP